MNIKSDELIKLKPKSLELIDALLASYIKKASDKNEIDRTKFAEDMAEDWNKITGIPAPAFPMYEDYWYLVQVLLRRRHVDRNSISINPRFGRKDDFWIESFSDTNPANSSLLTALYTEFRKAGGIFDDNRNNTVTRNMSRRDCDKLLRIAGDSTIKLLGFDPRKYHIANIPIEIYLAHADLNLWGNCERYTHLHGYRLRDDEHISSLIAGNSLLGGASCIDSVWMDYSSEYLIARFAIIKETMRYEDKHTGI